MQELVYNNQTFTVNNISLHPLYDIAVGAFLADAAEVTAHIEDVRAEANDLNYRAQRLNALGARAEMVTRLNNKAAQYRRYLSELIAFRDERLTPSASEIFDYLKEHQDTIDKLTA